MDGIWIARGEVRRHIDAELVGLIWYDDSMYVCIYVELVGLCTEEEYIPQPQSYSFVPKQRIHKDCIRE